MAKPPGAAPGERLLLQRARPGVVMALVGMHGAALALFVGVPAVIALPDAEYEVGLVLAAATCILLALFLPYRGTPTIPPPRRVEALLAVAFAFMLASPSAMPGFILAGFTPIDALFESVSTVTTTGLSTAPTVENLPLSVQFLRFWLQWLGGFAFAAMAIALIAGPGIVALRLGMVEGPGETLRGSARVRARAVLGGYLAITVIAVTGSALTADTAGEGALLALAAVSTGGFGIADDSLATSTTGLRIALTLACLAGAVSMTVLAQSWHKGLRTLLADPEPRLLPLLACLGAVGVVAIEALRPDGASVRDSIFTAVSAQSTAGFSTSPISELAPGSILLLILLMTIGGSLGSSAGGLKLFRVAMAYSAVRLTILRSAISPNAVTDLRIFGRKADPREATDVFVLVFIYVVSVIGLWAGFVLSGHEPLRSLFDTVSAVSTVGLPAGIVWPDLPDGLKLGVTLAMLLGRLEFLAVIVLVLPRTWVA